MESLHEMTDVGQRVVELGEDGGHCLLDKLVDIDGIDILIVQGYWRS